MLKLKIIPLNNFVLITLFFTGLISISASPFVAPVSGLPENTEIRRMFYDRMTGTNKDAVSTLPEWKVIEETGVRVNFFTTVETHDDGKYVYFSFSHKSDLEFDKGSIGSYIIKRSLDRYDKINFGIEQIKIFYKNNNNSFLRLKPAADNKESLLEIKLYGKIMQKDIRVPLSLAELSRRPFADLANLTSSYVDWNFYISDYKKLYGDDVRMLSSTIAPLLYYLKDKDDGAIDQAGNFVFIDSLDLQTNEGGLNCSGFVKWIADGLYKASTGENIDIAFLKSKHYELRGNKWSRKLEAEKDPYFGLDWTRNLAYEILKLQEPEALISSVDVNNLHYEIYRANIGFPLEDIKTVLYELAVTNPQDFYLGSLNSKSKEPPYLREHTHVLALFPYIDQENNFQVVIYSRNEQISLDYLKSHWKDNYIHLVKIEASPNFEPSGINLNPVLRR